MAVALPSTTTKRSLGKELITKENFYIRSNNRLNRVRIGDILWIHADGNYCYIHTKNKKFAVKISLRKLAEKLSPREFIRIHKSYIVRTACIDGIDINENTACIGNHRLPIGRVYKVDLFDRLEVL